MNADLQLVKHLLFPEFGAKLLKLGRIPANRWRKEILRLAIAFNFIPGFVQAFLCGAIGRHFC